MRISVFIGLFNLLFKGVDREIRGVIGKLIRVIGIRRKGIVVSHGGGHHREESECECV